MHPVLQKNNKFRLKIRIVPVLLILTMSLLLWSCWSHSYSYNENGRLASGLYYLTTGDYSIFHVNPPLVNTIGAIPAVIAGARCPDRNDFGFSTFGRYEYQAGSLFDKFNNNNFSLVFGGRMICIFLYGVCILFFGKYTKNIFGLGTDSVTLSILIFSPWFLAYSPLILPDVPSAVMGLLSLFVFYRWLNDPSRSNAFTAGLTLGLAELCKFTLLIFYPLFVFLWLLYRIPEWRRKFPLRNATHQFTQLVLLVAVSLLVINMGYFFENSGKRLDTFRFRTTLFTGCKTLDEVPSGGGNRFTGTLLGKIPMPLPANFIQGIDTQRYDFERGLASYLREQWSDHGWWYYYLYALLIKTPVGTILLFFLAVFCTLFLKGYNVSWRDEMVVLLPGIVLLTFVSSQTGFSVHSRYVIPALPFFFVWMSKLGRAFTGIPQNEKSEETVHQSEGETIKEETPPTSNETVWPQGYRTICVLTILFLTWSIVSSLSVYPHSISYFNELAVILPTPKRDAHPRIPPIPKPESFYDWYQAIISAGPRNGPRHLLNSNIDWGQDLFNLERWCKKHPEVTELKVSYWGSYPVEMTTIPNVGSPSEKAEPGWYAISVNKLFSREGEFRYFLDFSPVAMAGYSIYIYHLTQEDIDKIQNNAQKEEVLL